MSGNLILLICWKNYWENIINYSLRKVNVDTINWEKLLEAFQQLYWPQIMQYTVIRKF